MKTITTLIQCLLLYGATIGLAYSNSQTHPEQENGGAYTAITIRNEALHEISPLFFGQFCEQTAPNATERGAEAAWDAARGAIRSDVLEQIRELHPELIRFPGGTQVDYCDWTAFIANVPGAVPQRLEYQFGVDAFMRVCREVGAQPLLVVNLRDGIMKLKPLAEAARQAAGLVAYCNAPVGAKLPDGMPDWPALRASNGSRQPFGVKYFQIGNESWFYDPKDVEWKMTVLQAYIDAMRAVDPTIEIIADAHPAGFPQLCRERLGDRLNMLAVHSYMPFGSLDKVLRDEQPVAWEKMTPEETWLGLTSAMPVDPATGFALLPLDFGAEKNDHGYGIAVTEWNWNSWGKLPGSLPLNLDWIRAFGAANYLHAMLREPKIGLTTQSMLIGTSWDINAIRVDPAGKTPPFMQPVGAVTGFYAAHHGRKLLQIQTANVPTYRQPLTVGGARQGTTVAAVDVVATGDKDQIWVHVINRQYKKTAPLKITLEGFSYASGASAKLYLLQEGGTRVQMVSMGADGLEVAIPPRTIACVELTGK